MSASALSIDKDDTSGALSVARSMLARTVQHPTDDVRAVRLVANLSRALLEHGNHVRFDRDRQSPGVAGQSGEFAHFQAAMPGFALAAAVTASTLSGHRQPLAARHQCLLGHPAMRHQGARFDGSQREGYRGRDPARDASRGSGDARAAGLLVEQADLVAEVELDLIGADFGEGAVEGHALMTREGQSAVAM
jgi:hypothetical protein